MSAFPKSGHVRRTSQCPLSANSGHRPHSLDHLVGAADQRVWDVEAERLCGLEIDVQLDFRGLLDRQVGRLIALENPAGIDAG